MARLTMNRFAKINLNRCRSLIEGPLERAKPGSGMMFGLLSSRVNPRCASMAQERNGCCWAGRVFWVFVVRGVRCGSRANGQARELVSFSHRPNARLERASDVGEVYTSLQVWRLGASDSGIWERAWNLSRSARGVVGRDARLIRSDLAEAVSGEYFGASVRTGPESWGTLMALCCYFL